MAKNKKLTDEQRAHLEAEAIRTRKEESKKIADSIVKNPCVMTALSVHYQLKNTVASNPEQNVISESFEEALVKFSQPGTTPIEEILAMQLLNLSITANHWLALSATQKNIVVKEKYAGLALRAMETSRKTAATLADIKNPRKATFIKNALQVNNSPALNSENFSVESRNKLITEGETHAPLDLGSQTGTSTEDSELEAVEVLNRPQN